MKKIIGTAIITLSAVGSSFATDNVKTPVTSIGEQLSLLSYMVSLLNPDKNPDKEINYKYVAFYNKYHQPLGFSPRDIDWDKINSVYAATFLSDKDSEEYVTKIMSYTYKNNFGDVHSEFLISDKSAYGFNVNPFNIIDVDIPKLYSYVYSNFFTDFSDKTLIKVSYQRNGIGTADLVGFTIKDKNDNCVTYYITPDYKYTDIEDDVCFNDDTINYK